MQNKAIYIIIVLLILIVMSLYNIMIMIRDFVALHGITY